MTDDIFKFRDQFISQVARVFESEGWSMCFYKSEGYWDFKWSLTEVDVSVLFSGQDIRQLTTKPRLSLHAGVSKPELDSIKNTIMPPIKGGEPQSVVLAGLTAEEKIPLSEERYDAFIRGLSGMLVKWGEAQDIEAGVAGFTKPWRTEQQLCHLAALAYVGDFNTLMDYQEMFKSGKRANFYPYITPEMIDRAVDIAIERA
ncbi:DUF6990 domain-containing protein [Halocynthiibacter styelae]|uniref:DUF4304 domain-containing protein n=1 Tax=Halocynthiibacter styelae TaxID=2761955 RepID=A0A8J7IEU3_9RHOB|nr:hypothetical protein [Paenihalocynthiibacter styelae]MBI1495254.1 hypothetical protein [Paenihalocynthiibacter styelae]